MSEKYDPYEHWNTREHPNTAEDPGLNPAEHNFFGPKLAQAQALLELGPGVGRLFPLYKGVPRVETLDLSTNYQTRAQASADAAGVSINANYIDDPLAPFSFEDNTFDLGIACHVLMHIPFENIEHSMSELARCCRTVAVITAEERSWPRKGTDFDPRWHCFAHDYEKLCEELGFAFGEKVMITERETIKSYAFTFQRSP